MPSEKRQTASPYTSPFFWGVVAVVIAAAFLRFDQLLAYPGLTGDEADLALRSRSLFTDGSGWLTYSGFFAPFALVFSWSTNGLGADPVFGIRVPFAVFELVACLVAGLAFGRVTERSTALFAFLLLLCMPTFMVMGRIAWEPSLVPLASVLVFCAVLARRFLPAVILLILGMLTHPTAIFLAPLLFLAWATDIAGRGALRSRESLLLALSALAIMGAGLGALALSTTAQVVVGAGADGGPLSPSEWLALARYLVEFVSGVGAYESVAGRPGRAMAMLQDAAALAVIGAAALGIALRLTAEWRLIVPVLVGLGIGILAQFVLSGSSGFAPSNTRYLLWMSGPFVWAMAHGLSRLTQPLPSLRWGVLVLTAASLLSFHTHFLRVFAETGGQGMFLYRAHPDGIANETLAWLRRNTPLSEGEPIAIGFGHQIDYPAFQYLAGEGELDFVKLPERVEEWTLDAVEAAFPAGAYFVASPYPDARNTRVFVMALDLEQEPWAELLHVIRHPSGSELVRLYRIGARP